MNEQKQQQEREDRARTAKRGDQQPAGSGTLWSKGGVAAKKTALSR